MPPRLFVDFAPQSGMRCTLPAAAARHVQVLRLQPGDALALFDGSGGEWDARVVAIGRSGVEVDVGARGAPAREAAVAVTLAVGMPANERMDGLVEKATELGVAAIQPLVCARAVLRLAGERAERRVAHWQAVAVAACEQSGRVHVPRIAPVAGFGAWLAGSAAAPAGAAPLRIVLSTAPDAATPAAALPRAAQVVALSGPEGGLAPDEEAAARAAGFVAVTLGPRVLRADTAPLALLAWLALR